MAHTQELTIPSHCNIYTGESNRSLKIVYSIPQEGTNKNTGMLLFVPGFGGNINSNVYKKMRDYFADNYNLVTVQCDYFGSKFMQSANDFHLKGDFNSIRHYFDEHEINQIMSDNSKLLELLLTKDVAIDVYAKFEESLDEFVDMGYMQAIDNLTAIEAIKIILNENNLLFDEGNVIGYGHSQGAYLLHLCNRMSPFTFSKIVDNSAWIRPEYLYKNRILLEKINQFSKKIEFDYIAKNVLVDSDALDLNYLYKEFNNGAYIYSYLGTTDFLVDVNAKKTSIEHLDYLEFHLIDSDKLDGEIFKSTNHGLDANFIKMLESVLEVKNNHRNSNPREVNYTFLSSKTKINVDYSNGLPLFSFEIIEK